MNAINASAVLDRVNNLPSVPKVIRELMAEFEKPDTDVDRVATLIQTDPVIAAKVLRLANSAFYGRKGQVSRLNDAVVFIGTHAARNLVMSVGLASAVKFPERFPKQSFWRYSLHSAVAARHLASCSRQDAETAFALGLMRAIGEPIAAGVVGKQLEEIDAQCPFFDVARIKAERDKLGFSYVEVSAALAERWQFPSEMTAALRYSDISDHASSSAKMGALVAVGAWVAGEFEVRPRTPDWIPDRIKADIHLAGLDEVMLKAMPPLNQLAQGLESLVA